MIWLALSTHFQRNGFRSTCIAALPSSKCPSRCDFTSSAIQCASATNCEIVKVRCQLRVDLQGLLRNPAVASESSGSRRRLEPQAQALPRMLAITDSNIAHILDDMPNNIQIGSFDVEWMATPGHTQGSVCYSINGHLFTGDTLMGSGPGRTDLPGGDPDALAASIDKISKLGGELLVMPGHGTSFKLSEFTEAATA